MARGAAVVSECGGEGVDDDEGGFGACDVCFQGADVVWEGEGSVIEFAVFGVDVFDGHEEEDVGRVASGGLESRFDGAARVVVGGDEDDVAWFGGGVAGHGLSGCNEGGDGGGE